MRVLMWMDDAYEGVPGGHRVQMDRTAEALERLGVQVAIVTHPTPDFSSFDIVHNLGAGPAGLRRAREAGIPIVMSTIYSSHEYILGADRGRLARHRQFERTLRLTVSLIRRGPANTARRLADPLWQLALAFEGCDLLLPNSISECRAVRDQLAVSTPMHVVPNGADQRTFALPAEPVARRGVVYAGRIDPLKNQLGLIRALKGTGIPLTIVGAPHRDHDGYLERCRREADESVTFIAGIDQQELAGIYQGAAVHAMPSWFETTGLSSLEAALCGAAVVTTSRGYASEYFEDDAHYCDPADVSTIRSAVIAALEAGPSEHLRQRILDRFTWDHAAEATLTAYERVLELTAARRSHAGTSPTT